MNRKQTKYVALDTDHCEACWQCVAQCPKQVIGKVSVLWHRHVVFRHPEACIGCRRCVKICPHGAITVVDQATVSAPKRRRKTRVKLLLLSSTVAIAATGVGLHATGHGASFPLWHRWAVAHVAFSLLWLVLAVHHVWQHRRWYRAMLSRRVVHKGKLTLLLTALSLALWATGTLLLVCIDEPQSAVGLWHYGLGVAMVVLSAHHVVRRWRQF